MVATVSPNISALRPPSAPTTASGRASYLTAAHEHTSPLNTANCRSLPHIAAQNYNTQGQARGGKCDTRDGKSRSRNGAYGDEHQ